LIIYIILGTIGFSLFLFLRPRLKSVFGVNPMSKFPKTFVSWIPSLLLRPDKETIKKFGLDVGMSLIILKNMVYMISCYTFFGLFFTLPVDATASGGQKGLSHYTISNIPSTEMNRYSVHILGIIWNTLITCFFVQRMWERYAHFRRREWRKQKLHNFTICITKMHNYTPQEIYNYFDKIFPGEVIDVYKVEDIDDIVDLKSKRMNYIYALEKARAKNTSKAHKVPRSLDFCLCCEPCCCCTKKVPAQSFYLDRTVQLENEIREKQNGATYTKVAYVSFRHISTAMECAQLSLQIGNPHIAPELYDVRWSNHSIDYRTIPVRTWIANVVILFLCLFWTALIAIATSFSNLNTFANYLPFLNYLPIQAKAVIGSIIPPLIIIISFAVLKFLLSLIMDKTAPLTHSKLDKLVFNKLFLFYAINVFLVSLLASTFLETWSSLVKYSTELSPIAILLLLAENIGVQSAFFMIYILALSFSHIIAILHPGNIIVGGWKRWSAVTPREKLGATLPAHYQIHIDMAQHCLIFLAVLCFSTISPLILPLGLVYLCLIYFQMAFETTYTSYQEYDGFGEIFPAVVKCILISLFIHQLVMAGMFILSTFYYGLIICVLCVVGTALFINYNLTKIGRIAKYGMVDDVTSDRLKERKHEDNVRGYIHPGMWDAATDLEDINRLNYSIRMAQNQVATPP